MHLSPPRLGRWAIPVRFAVANACFAGGFLCARLFDECLRGAADACTLDTPDVPSLLLSAIALVLIVPVLHKALRGSASLPRRVSSSRALLGALAKAPPS